MSGVVRSASITLTAAEREVLRALILDHLTGIDGIYIAITRGEWGVATRLGREYADDLMLMEALDWERQNGGDLVDLSLPTEQAVRAFRRIQAEARSLREEDARQTGEERGETVDLIARSSRLELTAERVLRELEAQSPSA